MLITQQCQQRYILHNPVRLRMFLDDIIASPLEGPINGRAFMMRRSSVFGCVLEIPL